MDGTGEHSVEWDKPSSKSQITCFHLYVDSRPKMIIIITIMGHEYKQGTCLMGEPAGG
jgi:hypothetical protein